MPSHHSLRTRVHGDRDRDVVVRPEAPVEAAGVVRERLTGEATAFVTVTALLALVGTIPLVPWYGDLRPMQVALSVAYVLACAAGATAGVLRGLRPCLLVASVFPYCWLAVPSVYQIAHRDAAWGDPGVTADVVVTLTAQALLLFTQVALLAG